MDTLLQDVRFAVRTYVRRPAFTAMALVTIALGIGANTAIFSVVRPLLLTPLPFPEADRVVHIDEGVTTRPDANMVANPSNYDAWEKRSDVLTHLAGFSGSAMTLTGAGDAVRLKLTSATPSLFAVFGVAPALGRTFTDDEANAKQPVIVLSDTIWRAKFGADPNVVNQAIMLDGKPWRVTGIMPAGFSVPYEAEGWVPLAITPEMRVNHNTWFLQVAARLAPGVTRESAAAALSTSMAQLNAAFPKFNRNRYAKIRGWKDAEVSEIRSGLWLLQAVTLAVLLIACANLANLLMAHSTERVRELAIRSAIGAGRRQLVRQLLTESVLLSVIGGLMGAALAVWAVPAIAALAPTWLPRAKDLHVGFLDVAGGIVLSVIAGLAFGILPTMLVLRRGSSRLDLTTRGVTSGRSQRFARSALVSAQVCIALVLLVGAGLLLQSFARLTALPIGFDTDRVLTAQLSLPAQSYGSGDKRRALFTSLLEQMSAQPGVRFATASTVVPFTWFEWMNDFPVIGRSEVTQFDAAYRVVTPGYFPALNVPLIRGRLLTDADSTSSPRVAVVNQEFARTYSALGNVIGVQFRSNGVNGEAAVTIVGIVGDTKHRSYERPAQAEVFFPLSQSDPTTMTLVIRTDGNPTKITPVLRRVVSGLDGNLPLSEIKTLSAWVGASVAERRFYMVLLTVFAGLAVSLAIVGIYGVTSYMVRLRTREIGIRLALGATASGVVRLVVRQGLAPVVVGSLAGIALALATARVLRNQLFQIEPRDPVTIIGTGALLLLVGLLACWWPSRRTSRVEPSTVLRME